MKTSRLLLALGCVVVLTGTFVVVAPVQANHGDRSLEVTPETDRNPLGDHHKMVATVSSPADTQILVDWKIIDGPNAVDPDRSKNLLTAPDYQCQIFPGETTCEWEYRDRRASGGTDIIVVWIDHDGDNATAEADANELADAGGTNEPACPEAQCGPDGQGGAGDTAEPDATDSVTKDWGQLGARRISYTDGEIFYADRTCDSQTTHSGGEVALVTKGCLFTYQVSPEVQVQGNEDHGAVWAQSSVDTRRGWCTKRVTTTIAVPPDAMTMGTAPESSSATQRAVRETMLPVGSLSVMSMVPSLYQSFFAYPGTIRVSTSDDGSVIKMVWRGSTRQDLAFALGAWISFPKNTDIGTIDAGNSVDKRAVRQRTC